ncbi:Cytochrome c oxidase subunit 6B1 [Turnera subulata]|uniref:Cytochrome c oxidase subunit 6B1 n=1 Tax=Turnera subulata TaxID=218843 RepID=A0A9Q0GDJ7_9ROSI|nr:Cytochrome c oxidase subunit 6B1 [Turnera subulata]
MSAAQVDPHDKMRSRDMSKVAMGEQAPKPPHEQGHINQAPSAPSIIKDIEEGKNKFEEPGTAVDIRFPTTNQTRNCYTRYLEYHWCIKEKGSDAPECEKFAKYYRSLCPTEWVTKWNEQRGVGVFPGPI